MTKRRSGWRQWLGSLIWLLTIACGGKATPGTAIGGTDSESHFLSYCTPGSCPAPLECLEGACTLPCNEDATCTEMTSNAACVANGGEQSPGRCDVSCQSNQQCIELGYDVCALGNCRKTETLGRLQSYLVGCQGDGDCSNGLSCIEGTCVQACTTDADCEGLSMTCLPQLAPEDPRPTYCGITECGGSHEACAVLGPGGRCDGLVCHRIEAGQCGDIGAPNSEWRCLEDMLETSLLERAERFPAQPVCIPSSRDDDPDASYLVCDASACAGGVAGCEFSEWALALELENQRDRFNAGLDSSLRASVSHPATPVLATLQATGEVCEYRLRLRSVEFQVNIGVGYAQPSRDSALSSVLNLGSNWWQAVPIISGLLPHTPRSPPLSELVSVENGDACQGDRRFVQQHVDSRVPVQLYYALKDWLADFYSQLECTPCGRIGCELACRFR